MLQSEDPYEQTEGIEILEQFLAAEESNNNQIVERCDALCRYVDHLRAQANFRMEQSQRLANLARSARNNADRMEQTLIRCLTTLFPGQTKFELPTHQIRSRKGDELEVDDPELLPPEFQRITVEADKRSLKAALKSGAQIPGVSLKPSRSWRVV